MKLGLIEDMHRIDKEAADTYSLPETLLMENAGRRSAEVVMEMLEGVRGKSLCVVAGSGNNGGDAMSAATPLGISMAMTGFSERLISSMSRRVFFRSSPTAPVPRMPSTTPSENFKAMWNLSQSLSLLSSCSSMPMRSRMVYMVAAEGFRWACSPARKTLMRAPLLAR